MPGPVRGDRGRVAAPHASPVCPQPSWWGLSHARLQLRLHSSLNRGMWPKLEPKTFPGGCPLAPTKPGGDKGGQEVPLAAPQLQWFQGGGRRLPTPQHLHVLTLQGAASRACQHPQYTLNQGSGWWWGCHSPQRAASPAQPHTGSTHPLVITQCSWHSAAWVQPWHPLAQLGWSQVGADPRGGLGAALGAAGHRWGWVALCQVQGQEGQRAWEHSREAWSWRHGRGQLAAPIPRGLWGVSLAVAGVGQQLLPTPLWDVTSLRLP